MKRHKVKGSVTVEATVITPIVLILTLFLLVFMVKEIYKAADLSAYQFMITLYCNSSYADESNNYNWGEDTMCSEILPVTSADASRGFQTVKFKSSEFDIPLKLISNNMVYRSGNRINDRKRIEKEE